MQSRWITICFVIVRGVQNIKVRGAWCLKRHKQTANEEFPKREIANGVFCQRLEDTCDALPLLNSFKSAVPA